MNMAVAGLELKLCSEKAALACLQPAPPQNLMCFLTHPPEALSEPPARSPEAGLRMSSPALATLFKYKFY